MQFFHAFYPFLSLTRSTRNRRMWVHTVHDSTLGTPQQAPRAPAPASPPPTHPRFTPPSPQPHGGAPVHPRLTSSVGDLRRLVVDLLFYPSRRGRAQASASVRERSRGGFVVCIVSQSSPISSPTYSSKSPSSRLPNATIGVRVRVRVSPPDEPRPGVAGCWSRAKCQGRLSNSRIRRSSGCGRRRRARHWGCSSWCAEQTRTERG